MSKKSFMCSPLTETIFKAMFKIKANDIGPVLAQYNVDEQTLYDVLWEKLNIPDMEVRIASTAFDFLIIACKEQEILQDLQDTLKAEIENVIVMSFVFYTNIAPNAFCTEDFEIPKV